MASVTNKVSMENLVPEASVIKSNRVVKILIIITAVACIFAVVMMALFVWEVTKKPSSVPGSSSEDDSSWPAKRSCPKIPLLLPLPSPLPQELQEAINDLDAYLGSQINENGLPAISANLFYKDRILWTGHYGIKKLGGQKPNNNTRYRIGSITKVFAVLMLYKMFEQGLIDSIDDPLSKYAPNFHINNPFNGENITLRQMASQMSGLPREAPCVTCVSGETTEDELLHLKNRSLVVEPGTVASYSNLAYALFGRILTEKINTTFEQWTTDTILTPLGLTNTGFNITEDVQEDMAFTYDETGNEMPFMNIGWLSPSGQMYSTIQDMARFGMFLTRIKTANKDILKDSSLREILAPVYISPDGQTIVGSPWEMVFHKNYLVRTKGGSIDRYLAMLSMVPELKFGFNLAISTFVNMTSGITNKILDRVYRNVLPVFNRTLSDVNTKTTFQGNAKVFCGKYNATQVDVISGVTQNFPITITRNEGPSLELRSVPLQLSLYYIKDESFLQGKWDTGTCSSQMLSALTDVYFQPKGSDGKSPGFTIPGNGIVAHRIPDQ